MNWINCTNKLPEVGQHIFVCYQGGLTKRWNIFAGVVDSIKGVLFVLSDEDKVKLDDYIFWSKFIPPHPEKGTLELEEIRKFIKDKIEKYQIKLVEMKKDKSIHDSYFYHMQGYIEGMMSIMCDLMFLEDRNEITTNNSKN